VSSPILSIPPAPDSGRLNVQASRIHLSLRQTYIKDRIGMRVFRNETGGFGNGVESQISWVPRYGVGKRDPGPETKGVASGDPTLTRAARKTRWNPT